MPKIKERISISNAQLKSELIKLFNSQNTDKGKCREILGRKYKIQVKRFYDTFNSTIEKWQISQEKAQHDQTVENTKEALKKGLKSKLERQLDLQNMLEPNFKVEEIVGVDVKIGKVIRAMRPLTPTEIKNIHIELSKMDGSYAPAKTEITGKDGSPLITNATIVINGKPMHEPVTDEIDITD